MFQIVGRHFGGRFLEGPHPQAGGAVLPESPGREDSGSGGGRHLCPLADRACAEGAVPPAERGVGGRAGAAPPADLGAANGDRGPQGRQRQTLREDPVPARVRRRLPPKPILFFVHRGRGGIALQEHLRAEARPLLHILQPGMKVKWSMIEDETNFGEFFGGGRGGAVNA